MSEQENSQAGQATENQGPQVALQRFYLKDASFEAPNSPEIFQNLGAWRPNVQMDIGSSSKNLSDDLKEITLQIQVHVTHDEKSIYLVEVAQAGIFTLRNFEEEQLRQVIGIYCPSVLYPYAREAVSDLVTKGGFPQLLLQPVNFEQFYEQAQKKMGPVAGHA